MPATRTLDRSRRRGPARRLLPVLLFLLVPLAPFLSGSRSLEEPIELKIIGYIDATEEATNAWAMLDIWLQGPPDRRFALENIIVLTPGTATGGDILAAIRPIRPNIIFNGEQSLLDEISNAKPTQRIEIVGTTAFGPRRILVSRVQVAPPAPAPTGAPSPAVSPSEP